MNELINKTIESVEVQQEGFLLFLHFTDGTSLKIEGEWGYYGFRTYLLDNGSEAAII